MPEPVQGERGRARRFAVLAVVILVIAAVGVALAYSHSGGEATSTESHSTTSSSAMVNSSPVTTSRAVSLSTIGISNSTGLGNLETAENSSNITFEFPTLDPNSGLVYGLTANQNGTNRLLTSFNTTSLAFLTVQSIPGTGIGLAVDPTTNEVFVAVAPPPCTQGLPAGGCSSDQGSVLRVNASTGQIEGKIPVSTYGFGVSMHGSGIGIDSGTDTLLVLQPCPTPSSKPGPNVALLPPCGRILAYGAQTGALLRNNTLPADFQDFVVAPVTGLLYIGAAWEPQAGGANYTQGVIAVDVFNLSVDFIVPMNVTSVNALSIDEGPTIAPVVYGLADNGTSANFFAISGRNGYVIFSNVVGSADSLRGVPTVNTLTNQVYLGAFEKVGCVSQGANLAYLVVLDGTTGKVVGMIDASPQGPDTLIISPAQGKVYAISSDYVSGTTIAAFPSAVFVGNVIPSVLNASCPVPPPV